MNMQLLFLRRLLLTRNVGPIDRVLRAAPACLVGLAAATGAIGGAWLWAAGAVAAMLLVTAVSGSCSIYYLLGFSTCPVSGLTREEALNR